LALFLAASLAQADTPMMVAVPREKPVRRVDPLPAGARAGEAAHSASARPGEFHVFQVALQPTEDCGPVDCRATPLQGEGGTAIPSAAIRCLSLGGVGSDGQPLRKSVVVPGGGVQVLWFGVEVPKDASGDYRGQVELLAGSRALGRVDVALKVAGDAVADHGDSVAANLSRLRWLDSVVGGEPTVTKPFVSPTVRGRTIAVLGRELELGDDGLPARVRSFFTPANTAIDPRQPREVLAAPFVFRTGSEWRWTPGAVEADALEARWTAAGTADGLSAAVTGRMDFTGSGEVRLRLTATREATLADARLETAWREDAAEYFMGFGAKGGRRPAQGLDWAWDVAKRQDCFWMGDVNAGMMLRFKDAQFVRPLVNIYYSFLPLRLPDSWGNGGAGGFRLAPAADGRVAVAAFSGPRSLAAGQSLDFVFEFYLTPFRPLDTEKQWAVRFVHPHPGRDPAQLDRILETMDAKAGPNVLNVHQAQYHAPFINYPYADENFQGLRDVIRRAHEKGVKARVYYTTRELTQNLPELHALHSMNGEIIFPGPGREARTLIHKNGPHPWLVENLGADFIPAWVDRINRSGAEWDLSVITRPDSRWNNFYLEGLRWMVEQAGLDGVYIDETALDARSLQRARRILDTAPGRLIDLHTWNHMNGWAGYANNLTIYMEILPYLDRLWIGEGFNAGGAAPDFWLVEMSGLPFGLMGEMLDGANPWKGLVFGETARLGWSGDPRSIWKAWDDYGIRGTEFLPYFAQTVVRTGRDDVLATVYRGRGRSLLALASWAGQPVAVTPEIAWTDLGLDATKASLYAPSIAGVQSESLWKPGEAIEVMPGRGWFLVLDEQARKVARAADAAADLVEVFREGFTAPGMPEGWREVKSAKDGMEVRSMANALTISGAANRFAGIERDLPKGVRAASAELDGGTDVGQTWGPGIALVWPGGATAKINLRLEDRKFGTLAGDGLRILGGPLDRARPEAVRILLGDEWIYFQARTEGPWRDVDVQSRAGRTGDPAALRLGKMAENGVWADFPGAAGVKGECSIRDVAVFGK
jgi:hypothetical protein